MFEEVRFTVCDPGNGRLELVAAARNEPAVRRLADFETSLGEQARQAAFAMNAGMYDENGRPIGLAIVDGRQVRAINRRKGGGNFHLMPNGVFQVHRDGRAEIVTSDNWKPSPTIRIATQSGPMLVIDGKKIVKDLPLNTPVELTVTIPKPGKVGYACAMDMIRGSITAQ